MASSVPFEDEGIFTCSICLEHFNIPKYLPCLHTFCKICIMTYITSSFEKGQQNSIDCPVCRSRVNIPKENYTSEEWAETLPLNFLINGLMEKQKVERPDKLCMLCERFGSETLKKARFICTDCSDTLCDTCCRYHNSMKFTSTHEIRSIDETYVDKGNLFFVHDKCTTHKSKSLELFCSDHEIPCCGMCVAIKHRTCRKVISIEDAARGFSSSQNAQDIKRDLEDISKKTEKIINDNRKVLADIELQFNNESRKTDDLFRTLIDELTALQNERKQELLNIFTEKKKIIEDKTTVIENRKKAIGNDSNILNISQSKASDVQALIEFNKIKKTMGEHKTVIKNNEICENYNLEVVSTEDYNAVKDKLPNILLVKCDKILPQTVDEKEVFRINRFKKLAPSCTNKDSGWTVNGIDAISFSVSKDILLVGFLTYGCIYCASFKLYLSLKSNDRMLYNLATTLTRESSKDNIIKLSLENPIKLLAKTTYHISTRIVGSQCCYGDKGIPKVQCQDVTFTFKNSDLSTNGTSTKCGQIPGFLFKSA